MPADCIPVPFLPVTPKLPAVRQQSRQKLATLSRSRFLTFVSAVLQEIGRREGDGTDSLRDMWLSVTVDATSPAVDANDRRHFSMEAAAGSRPVSKLPDATLDPVHAEIRRLRETVNSLQGETHHLRQAVTQQSGQVHQGKTGKSARSLILARYFPAGSAAGRAEQGTVFGGNIDASPPQLRCMMQRGRILGVHALSIEL